MSDNWPPCRKAINRAAYGAKNISGLIWSVAEMQRSECAAERETLMKLCDGMRKFVRRYEFIAQVGAAG
ncbi:hypothetical protein Ga0074115_10876 [endosymbiont of Ridgeia piscesae]|uniref:Uncharacterized protein n=1 Tax=endosymbiont of Ridgeia piscesae TaxID=54398 RepID=A0A0T5Z6Z5_9GAMM|nr:hypothetical protein Ga0074115_10876 [endosymbiont of Ridgeia piscesae]KRT58690.1 hypothetical protein Ga0076813_14002 [endosymbiont of Ridgeia piscesae]